MMLRYALQTVRDRKAGFLGAFVALLCAAALVTACGTLLETGLRGKIGTERYAATPILVSADQNVHETTVKEKKGGRTGVLALAATALPGRVALRVPPVEVAVAKG